MNKLFYVLLLWTICLTQSAFAGEQVFFYHTDQAGTPLAMTDSSGAVVWKADYKPFGEEQTVTATISNDIRFVGNEKDAESGLSYFGARYENAKIGRFIAPDPVHAVDPKTSETNEKILLDPQRLNTYVYALNNPYRYVDADGRDPYLLSRPEPNYALMCHINPHFDRKENLIGGAVLTTALLSVSAGPEVLEWISTTFSEQSTINSKIYIQLEKQLERDGAKSIHKALRSAEKTLQQHKDKLPDLQYKSQVEGTIKNVEKQIRTLHKFIKDHKI
jgi:RHS repeat-associated protein